MIIVSQIVRDHVRLHEIACEFDGVCKVAIVRGNDSYKSPAQRTDHLEAFGPDIEMSAVLDVITWDYYHTDEIESFDYDRFGLTRDRRVQRQ